MKGDWLLLEDMDNCHPSLLQVIEVAMESKQLYLFPEGSISNLQRRYDMHPDFRLILALDNTRSSSVLNKRFASHCHRVAVTDAPSFIQQYLSLARLPTPAVDLAQAMQKFHVAVLQTIQWTSNASNPLALSSRQFKVWIDILWRYISVADLRTAALQNAWNLYPSRFLQNPQIAKQIQSIMHKEFKQELVVPQQLVKVYTRLTEGELVQHAGQIFDITITPWDQV